MDQTRRKILKVIAAAPLAITFGFAGEALMRFAKPSMKPLGVFDPSDMPSADHEVTFNELDFPVPWTCIPFNFTRKITVFSPEKKLLRRIPGFAIRLADDEIVAYSRICTSRGCILNFRLDGKNCGCHPEQSPCCSCAIDVANPVLQCPHDGSVFDLANDGRVIRGPAGFPARKFQMTRTQSKISILNLPSYTIVG